MKREEMYRRLPEIYWWATGGELLFWNGKKFVLFQGPYFNPEPDDVFVIVDENVDARKAWAFGGDIQWWDEENKTWVDFDYESDDEPDFQNKIWRAK